VISLADRTSRRGAVAGRGPVATIASRLVVCEGADYEAERFLGVACPTCRRWRPVTAVTLYGVAAVTLMLLMYALESRGRRFILLFALGCLLSSAYGFLSGAWPFGVVEAIWSVVAVRRYLRTP
jgi:hypothetical protein